MNHIFNCVVAEVIRGAVADTTLDAATSEEHAKTFDVVIAAYHDQGLAAVKTLEFDSAVNVTLGLPYLRTSPDHGTAYEIAGQGRANPGSYNAAIRVLRELTA